MQKISEMLDVKTYFIIYPLQLFKIQKSKEKIDHISWVSNPGPRACKQMLYNLSQLAAWKPPSKVLFMLHLLCHSHKEYVTHLMHINYTRLAMYIDTAL